MLLFALMATLLSQENEDFVNQLFADNHKLMYKIALGILRSRELAEEAVQESFVKIIRNLERIQEIPCPHRTAFCVVIVKNTSLSVLRSQKRVVYLDDLGDIPDEETESVEQEYFAAEGIRRLLELIETLPPSDRTLLQLKWGRGMGYRQIGQLMGIGEEAAKKRGQRAVAKLRDKYKGEVAAHG